MDLEFMRSVFQDERLHVGLALVKKITVKSDKTKVFMQCELMPDKRKVTVTETWASVGDGSCLGDLAEVNDLIVVVFSDGDPDQAYSIGRLASKEETLPTQISDGHMVVKAKPFKKLYLNGLKVHLARTGSGDEPLVLGDVFKKFASDTLTEISKLANDLNTLASNVNTLASDVNTLATQLSVHMHPTAAPGAPSPPVTAALIVAAGVQAVATGALATATGTLATGVKVAIDALKVSPIQSELILSNVAYTERTLI